MKVHYVKVRVLSRHEKVEEDTEALNAILPEGTEVNEDVVEPELDGGVFTNQLHDLNAMLSGRKALDFLMKILYSLDDYDFKSITEKKESYVDDECNFYMRLSKKEAACGNTVLDSKDPIHVTVKLAAYPARKDKAIKALDELIAEAEDERKMR